MSLHFDDFLFLCLQKEKSNGNGEAEEEDLPELASLSNRFSYFENFNEKEETRKKKSRGGDEEGLEVDSARRECKAKSLVNKFKEMETRAANGESEGKFRLLIHFKFSAF